MPSEKILSEFTLLALILGTLLCVVMCVVKMLDTKEGRAQFECKIGWSDSWIPTLRLTIPASCPQVIIDHVVPVVIILFPVTR